MQRVVKALLGYGARMPKELMLYVKNMVFLDGAIARLAPDLDMLGRDRQHLDAVHAAPRRRRSAASSASTRRSLNVRRRGRQGHVRRGPVRRPPHLPRPEEAPRPDREAHARARRPLALLGRRLRRQRRHVGASRRTQGVSWRAVRMSWLSSSSHPFNVRPCMTIGHAGVDATSAVRRLGIDADQEIATAVGGDRHVPSDHEGEPAEHPPLIDIGHVREQGPDPLGELVVVGHRRTVGRRSAGSATLDRSCGW